MVFQHPENILMIVAAAAAIFVLYLVLFWRARRILKRFGKASRLVERGSRLTKPYLDITRAVVVVLIFMLLASAYWLQPQAKTVRLLPVHERAEVCFAIDASRSSLARDVRFIDDQGVERIMSRFNFAKSIVKKAKNIMSTDDVPCLIFFAETAIATVYIWTEYADVAWIYIDSDLKYADEYFVEYEIPQGSNFPAMILKALNSFSESQTKKILIVISDGEPEGGVETTGEEIRKLVLKAVQKAAQEEIAKFRKIHQLSIEFIGVGDITKASEIPSKMSRDGSAVVAYHLYNYGSKKGQPVLTRPDPGFLLSAAQSLGGKYRHVKDAEAAETELRNIFDREKKIVSWTKKEEMSDAWHYFVVTALSLLFVVPFLKSP